MLLIVERPSFEFARGHVSAVRLPWLNLSGHMSGDFPRSGKLTLGTGDAQVVREADSFAGQFDVVQFAGICRQPSREHLGGDL